MPAWVFRGESKKGRGKDEDMWLGGGVGGEIGKVVGCKGCLGNIINDYVLFFFDVDLITTIFLSDEIMPLVIHLLMNSM